MDIVTTREGERYGDRIALDANTGVIKTADEEAVRAALSGNAPGSYMLPYCTDPAEFKNPEVARKYIDGPQGFITITPNGTPQMGPKLLMIFVYYVLVGVCSVWPGVFSGQHLVWPAMVADGQEPV